MRTTDEQIVGLCEVLRLVVASGGKCGIGIPVNYADVVTLRAHRRAEVEIVFAHGGYDIWVHSLGEEPRFDQADVSAEVAAMAIMKDQRKGVV